MAGHLHLNRQSNMVRFKSKVAGWDFGCGARVHWSRWIYRALLLPSYRLARWRWVLSAMERWVYRTVEAALRTLTDRRPAAAPQVGSGAPRAVRGHVDSAVHVCATPHPAARSLTGPAGWPARSAPSGGHAAVTGRRRAATKVTQIHNTRKTTSLQTTTTTFYEKGHWS